MFAVLKEIQRFCVLGIVVPRALCLGNWAAYLCDLLIRLLEVLEFGVGVLFNLCLCCFVANRLIYASALIHYVTLEFDCGFVAFRA